VRREWQDGSDGWLEAGDDLLFGPVGEDLLQPAGSEASESRSRDGVVTRQKL
jgi:hypothetical protein